ncbi:MAG: hypothetical protein ACM3PU_12195 [Gemmatimonadota bacterium]
MRRLWRAWPLLAAGLVAVLIEAGATGLGIALGVGAFVSLVLARRPMPFKFGALALAGAVAFGFIAAILAALYGLTVHDLMTSADASHLMAKALGVAAVMLAVLGFLSLLWGSFFDPPDRGG